MAGHNNPNGTPDMEPEYGVLRPTINGGPPDRLDFYQDRRMNNRTQALTEVDSWRAKGQQAYVIVRQWELLNPDENRPSRAPAQLALCGWCDESSHGSAFHLASERWFPSCGRILHGSGFEVTDRWRWAGADKLPL